MLPDREYFNFRECIVGGDPCWLIAPKELGVIWTDDNYRYRSVIVKQSTGEIISSGFGKFVNIFEQPEFQPWDEKWSVRGTFKYDGSLIICSIHNGEFICRSRGTVNILQLPTGQEILDLVKKHNVEEVMKREFGSGSSFLFEYSSPSHVIVLREFQQPTLTFLGIIHHFDGYMVSRKCLKEHADMMNLEIPDLYEWESLSACIADVQAWEGKEGVVLQSPDGQILKKIKSDSYKRLHSMMFGMRSINSVLDVFMDIKTPKYSEFFKYIETMSDYEVAENCKDHILTITKAYTKVLEKMDSVQKFLDTLPRDYTRKEQAEAILYNFHDWRKSAAFTMLDKRQFDDKFIKQTILYEL